MEPVACCCVVQSRDVCSPTAVNQSWVSACPHVLMYVIEMVESERQEGGHGGCSPARFVDASKRVRVCAVRLLASCNARRAALYTGR
jgi:hypothetical protein